MNRILPLVLAALLITGCGIQRPLIAPRDIPAHEERMRRKQERLKDIPAPETAPAATTEPTPEAD